MTNEMENDNVQAETKEKQGVVSSFKEGYREGKQKVAEKAAVLKSNEPLENQLKKIKNGYIIILIVAFLGTFYNPLLAVAIIAIMILFLIDSFWTATKRDMLRSKLFKFDSNISDDVIFQEMMPILTKKYGMIVERREDGVVSINHQNVIYDIMVDEYNTFKIWWRLSVSRAFLPKNKYKSYKKMLAAMGIIGYEIQNAFNIQ